MATTPKIEAAASTGSCAVELLGRFVGPDSEPGCSDMGAQGVVWGCRSATFSSVLLLRMLAPCVEILILDAPCAGVAEW